MSGVSNVKWKQHKEKVSDLNSRHLTAFNDLGTQSLEVVEKLEVTDMAQLIDFDGTKMELFWYQYAVGNSVPINVLVKKGSDAQKLTSEKFKQVVELKNKTLVPVLNFYHRGSNWNGWFLIAPVHGSVKGWLKSTDGSLLFEGNGKERAMSLTFRTMLLDFFSLLSEMIALQIVPEKIKMEDLFLTLLNDNVPRIQMLLTEIRKVGPYPTYDEEWMRVWSDLEDVVQSCCTIYDCKLDRMSKKFLKFLPRCRDITQAKNYPVMWNQDDKAMYLYHIISGTPPFPRYVMKSKVNQDTGIQWTAETEYVIDMLLDRDINKDKEGKPLYKKSLDYDCLMLFRDTHKHFDSLPERMKERLNGTREGFVKMLEEWDPMIWTKLYEAIGPLGRQRLSWP